MHELSLCRAIASTAQNHACGRPVRRIDLEIGHFRQVVPETLQYCWELHTKGSDLDGCRLNVDYIPARIVCRQCEATSTLEHPVLRCHGCESNDVILLSGEEFMVRSIDIDRAAG